MPKKLKIFNTLGRSIEQIEPISGDEIGIYSCGPTVYDYAHIGNLRKYVFDDLLVRTLENFGYHVKHVMNITDVGHLTDDADDGEDKIEKGAKREGKSAWEIAKFYEAAFLDDLQKLNIKKPDVISRATEHIKQQIDLIVKLEKKGYTYKIDDGVYFDTSKLTDYGKLAGLNTAGQIEGARVETNSQKHNPTDFALWKFSNTSGESRRQMEWDSPWGVGFPGWHIECSAMSVAYLGQPFEIHTGGIDLIPVHHTNEIAQSEAAEGKPLAKYWVHSDFVLENGKKMAKSDGHFLRLSDLIEKGFDPLDYKFMVLGAHYRSKLNFSFEALSGARAARQKITNFAAKANNEDGSDEEEEFFANRLERFKTYLSEDLDTPKAFAVIFETVSAAYESGYHSRQSFKFLEEIDRFLALDLSKKSFSYDGIKSTVELDDDLIDMISKRNKYRQTGDFDQADELKAQITTKGYKIEDSKGGTSIDKIA